MADPPLILSRRALLGAAVALGAAAPLAATPIDRLALTWWRERHTRKLLERQAGSWDAVLLGDSITQQWETPPYRAGWEHFYGGRRVLNLGFSGDATSHLLWRIEHGEIDGLAPRAAVILIGANNFGRLGWSASDTEAGVGAVVSAVRSRLPAAGVLLQGVLPSDRGNWVAAQTAALNRALAARYAHAPDVTFRDVGDVLLRDGRVAAELFSDPAMTPPRPALHPSPEGQARIAAALEPDLARLLGDRPRT